MGFQKLLSMRLIVVSKTDSVWGQNAGKAFWRWLLGILNKLVYMWNRADPCLYYKWNKKFGSIVCLSFIDDMLIVCSADAMESIKERSWKLWIVMILER